MVKRIFVSIILISCYFSSNSQTLSELANLRIVGSINMADKILTDFGFSYENSSNVKKDSAIITVTSFSKKGTTIQLQLYQYLKKKVTDIDYSGSNLFLILFKCLINIRVNVKKA